MINNFWSFDYIIKRFREKAEERGIEVVEINEYNTSTICPKCNSDHTCKHKRLFKCLKCGLEAHRDAVGVINMGTLFGGMPIGVVAHPLLLMWNGMNWEPKRAMNNQPMSTLEAKSPGFSRGECQRHFFHKKCHIKNVLHAKSL